MSSRDGKIGKDLVVGVGRWQRAGGQKKKKNSYTPPLHLLSGSATTSHWKIFVFKSCGDNEEHMELLSYRLSSNFGRS